mmetsp:Transcript_78342/g.229620  ORF Transcript_78342/g.229620 Transcript_78342/m.229620 type:complete len:214 (-) Transcript_78342:65-706(-)
MVPALGGWKRVGLRDEGQAAGNDRGPRLRARPLALQHRLRGRRRDTHHADVLRRCTDRPRPGLRRLRGGGRAMLRGRGTVPEARGWPGLGLRGQGPAGSHGGGPRPRAGAARLRAGALALHSGLRRRRGDPRGAHLLGRGADRSHAASWGLHPRGRALPRGRSLVPPPGGRSRLGLRDEGLAARHGAAALRRAAPRGRGCAEVRRGVAAPSLR